MEIIMFFTCDNLAVELIEVAEFHHNNTHNVGARNFSSLSLRLECDTIICANKNKYHIKNNTLGFFPADCPYKRISKNEHMIVINFRIYNKEFDSIELFSPKNTDLIKPLFFKALEIFKSKYDGYKYDILKCFYMILKYAAKNFQTAPPLCSATLQEKIKHCINENFRNPDFTVETFAKMMHLSEVSLRKHVRLIYNKSPKQLISDMRLDYALMLINSREFKIYEVSHLCGFSDEKYFVTLFKKRFSVTPAKYLS